MLDIGLFELLAVTVVALLVVGPERMPELVRTVVGWIQRIRRFVSSVGQDIQSEDIRQILHQPQSTVSETIKTAQNTLDTAKRDITHHVRK